MPNTKAKNGSNKKSRIKIRSRRKNRSSKGNNGVYLSNNTTNAVQTRLRNQGRNTMVSKVRAKKNIDVNYARCRLTPFTAGSSNGIPDFCAAGKLVFDHRGAEDFTVNGSASLLILPTLPFGAAIKPDGATAGIVNIAGNSVTQATTHDKARSWIPISWYPDTIPTANPNVAPNSEQEPPISSKIRIAGVGFRLVCTSPASEIAGIVEVVDSEMTVQGRERTPFTAIYQTNASEGSQGSFASNVDVNYVNMSNVERNQAIVAKTVQMRPEMQPQGVLKHTGPYDWKAYESSPLLTVSEVRDGIQATEAWAYFTYGMGVNSTKYGSVFVWDSSFDVKRIRITTPRAVSFRLETIICCEYVLPATNPYARIATKRTTHDSASVELVDQAISNMPAAVSTTGSTNYLNKFLKAVSVGAPFVGSIFGPEGTAVGLMVSELSETLNQIL